MFIFIASRVCGSKSLASRSVPPRLGVRVSARAERPVVTSRRTNISTEGNDGNSEICIAEVRKKLQSSEPNIELSDSPAKCDVSGFTLRLSSSFVIRISDSPLLRVQKLLQPLPKQIEREHRQYNGHTGH